MDRIQELTTGQLITTALVAVFATTVAWSLFTIVYNLHFHPLVKFPGPSLAASSDYYKAYIELIQGTAWYTHLGRLHARYGLIVRVGPNELHFADPSAYHEIYNSSNRWDKEPNLYHSFNEDRSSFGFLTFQEAKERKDVLGRSFSLKAVSEAQQIVQEKVDALCSVFGRLAARSQTANISHAYRCMTMDIITYYCFGRSVDAMQEPEFKAPIVLAMDASLPLFNVFKHSSLIKNMILGSPRPISRLTSPITAGLVDLQEILETQINELASRPEKLDLLPHRMTIYHSLMNKESWKNGVVPSAGSLYEEAQALMFAGADTVGNTLMLATFHLLRTPKALSKLKVELSAVFPEPNSPPPPIQQLEQLPYLNACIKEALRMSSGVISGLPRIVPPGGAKICGKFIPGGSIVSIGSTFVHYNPQIFPDPETFKPERWLSSAAAADDKGENLDTWLVPFSRGPRACLGINLAWLELRLTMASVFRRFDMKLAPGAPKQLRFKEAFLPVFIDGPILVEVEKC